MSAGMSGAPLLPPPPLEARLQGGLPVVRLGNLRRVSLSQVPWERREAPRSLSWQARPGDPASPSGTNSMEECLPQDDSFRTSRQFCLKQKKNVEVFGDL